MATRTLDMNSSKLYQEYDEVKEKELTNKIELIEKANKET